MPELPEVETVKNVLLPIVKGRKILSIDVLRASTIEGNPNDFVVNLQNETFLDVTRIGKYNLPVFFEDGYVAIALDAERATQRIPTAKIIEIATILHKPVILLGGKEAKDIGQDIVSQLGDRAYNTCGELNINQCASLLQQSACVLTGDSAFMHLASALDKPVCSLWGSTVPEFGKYPYMPEQRNLFRIFEICSLKCRPCAQLGFKRCPRRHFRCMKNISAIEVADWINQY